MKRYDIKTTDTETLRKWYYLMSLGRALDEKAPSYLLQSLGWSYHAPYAGHDGIQLAIGQVFHRGEDYLFPYYRDMLTVLSAGMTAEEIILNGISKATDPSSGGRHMSNHFAKPEWHIENISSATGTHDLHAVGVPQVEYVLERAGPAAGAVVDVVGEAVGAAARLDAVGQEHEKLARLALDAAAEDQLVVDLDEGTAHGGYGDAHHPAHELHDRQEQADSDAAQARCAEYGLSGVGVEHQPHGKPKDSEDGPAEDDARDEREPRMDGREPDGRDKPDEQKQHAEQDGQTCRRGKL